MNARNPIATRRNSFINLLILINQLNILDLNESLANDEELIVRLLMDISHGYHVTII